MAAERARREATAELVDWLLRSRGVLSVAEMARCAGVTRKTVYDLIAAAA